MSVNVFPTPEKTRKVETLTSGSSWTVPTGVTSINATLIGGGGGGGGGTSSGIGVRGGNGGGGQRIETTFATTPGASISYGIGAGGTGGAGNNPTTSSSQPGTAGGNTTMTGATTAAGGSRGGGVQTANAPTAGNLGLVSSNYGLGGTNASSANTGATGGAGSIIIEYWV
jgi:hypothetical protein